MTMSPLTLNNSHSGDWECVTCSEDYNTATDKPWETEDGASLVCANCIRNIFDRSMEEEFSWPPRFGADLLHSIDFASILPIRLFLKVTKRLRKNGSQIRADFVAQAIKGQIPGQDYQSCPGCNNVVTLKDGCNHITCNCGTPFCFICGNEMDHGSAHFQQGGCPRFGQPTSERAIFDQPTPLGLVEGEGDLQAREELRERYAIFYTTWMWNVAVQAESDPKTAEVPDDERYPVTWPDKTVHQSMRAWYPVHGLDHATWYNLVANNERSFDRFEANGPDLGQDLVDHPALSQGLLARPVGGVFNMATHTGRMAAFMWMFNSVRAWTQDTKDSLKNCAVFDMGPDDGTRTSGAGLMTFLCLDGESTMSGRFSFVRMQKNGLLVTLNPPVDIPWRQDALISEAYWRLELLTQLWPRMNPRNNADFWREDDGWRALRAILVRDWRAQTGYPDHLEWERPWM